MGRGSELTFQVENLYSELGWFLIEISLLELDSSSDLTVQKFCSYENYAQCSFAYNQFALSASTVITSNYLHSEKQQRKCNTRYQSECFPTKLYNINFLRIDQQNHGFGDKGT